MTATAMSEPGAAQLVGRPMTALATTLPKTPGVRLSTAGWAAAGFVLLYLVGVGTAAGQQLDDAAMRWIAGVVTQDNWARALLDAVSAGSVILVGACLAVVTVLTRGPWAAALGALSGAAVLVGAEALKLALARPGFSVDALTNSFPSGHVAAVTGLAVMLLLAFPAGQWRRTALVAVTPIVALTGLATVVLAWHRPTDVVGSVLLGAVVGVVAARRAAGVPAPSSAAPGRVPLPS